MSRRPPPNPDEARRIVADHQTGASINLLATRYRRAATTITGILTAAGETWDDRRPHFPRSRPQVAARLAGQYRASASIQRLADVTGVSYGTCRTLLIEAGAQLRDPRGGPYRPDQATLTRQAEEAATLYHTGQSIRAIAAVLGRSYGWTRKTLKAQGVQLRTQGGKRR